MYKLNLLPDQQSYAASEGPRQVYAKLDGGMGRVRRDLLNAVWKADVQWTVEQEDFQYLQTFRRVTKDGTELFRMDLILNGTGIEEYECRMIPGTWRVTQNRGRAYVVKVQLEVHPGIGDEQFDEGLVTTYEGFGPEGSSAYNFLGILVNVTMPANMK